MGQSPRNWQSRRRYGCRCVAEPYYGDVEPSRLNNLRERILARLLSLPYWRDIEMSLYFFVGSGNGVTLNQIGHLVDVINVYEEKYIDRFYLQLIQKSIETNSIFVVDNFSQSYDFSKVLYSYRKANIQGSFAGDVIINDGVSHIIGKAHFDFFDEFKDPINIAQLTVVVRNYFSFLEDIPEKDLSKTFLSIANINERPYPVRDSWSHEINVKIKIE